MVLNRDAGAPDAPVDAGEMVWKEGRRRYVTHLLAERSRAMSAALKSVSALVCDICDDDVSARYGVQVIDAHHRMPLASWTGEQTVTAADITLVCPNCHRAVHALMRQSDAGYPHGPAGEARSPSLKRWRPFPPARKCLLRLCDAPYADSVARTRVYAAVTGDIWGRFD